MNSFGRICGLPDVCSLLGIEDKALSEDISSLSTEFTYACILRDAEWRSCFESLMITYFENLILYPTDNAKKIPQEIRDREKELKNFKLFESRLLELERLFIEPHKDRLEAIQAFYNRLAETPPLTAELDAYFRLRLLATHNSGWTSQLSDLSTKVGLLDKFMLADIAKTFEFRIVLLKRRQNRTTESAFVREEFGTEGCHEVHLLQISRQEYVLLYTEARLPSGCVEDPKAVVEERSSVSNGSTSFYPDNKQHFVWDSFLKTPVPPSSVRKEGIILPEVLSLIHI
eukprot:TRINITY_DN13715_c0_g1_i3.p1 TRINITY_DN13715_c0_g1~~TRINITY_DN13715_c0_g1_i3.p1  ORF type:complete len:286 (-),score=55.07 TRINITY_DN13715_c0_g1_i3:63-920(-)